MPTVEGFFEEKSETQSPLGLTVEFYFCLSKNKMKHKAL